MSSWVTMIISCFVLSDFPHSHSSALQSIVSILLWDYIPIYPESIFTCSTSLHPSLQFTQRDKSNSPELISFPEYSIVHDRVSFLTQQVLPPYKSCSVYLPMAEQPESFFQLLALLPFLLNTQNCTDIHMVPSLNPRLWSFLIYLCLQTERHTFLPWEICGVILMQKNNKWIC